jgi:hypothetical protein
MRRAAAVTAHRDPALEVRVEHPDGVAAPDPPVVDPVR